MTSFTPARGQQLKERSSIATRFFLDQQSVTPASAVDPFDQPTSIGAVTLMRVVSGFPACAGMQSRTLR